MIQLNANIKCLSAKELLMISFLYLVMKYWKVELSYVFWFQWRFYISLFSYGFIQQAK